MSAVQSHYTKANVAQKCQEQANNGANNTHTHMHNGVAAGCEIFLLNVLQWAWQIKWLISRLLSKLSKLINNGTQLIAEHGHQYTKDIMERSGGFVTSFPAPECVSSVWPCGGWWLSCLCAVTSVRWYHRPSLKVNKSDMASLLQDPLYAWVRHFLIS